MQTMSDDEKTLRKRGDSLCSVCLQRLLLSFFSISERRGKWKVRKLKNQSPTEGKKEKRNVDYWTLCVLHHIFSSSFPEEADAFDPLW